MISVAIDREPQNDNYTKLAKYIAHSKDNKQQSLDVYNDTYDGTYNDIANYIADTKHQGEKILYDWHGGCESDDYDLAIKEVVAAQNMNQRVTTAKTYHLMVSFHPEDEEKLTEEVFQDIEKEFTDALGFTLHQRHCGVHKNTNNIHMHISYNMINPYTFTKHSPYKDHIIQKRIREKLEQKYELVPDGKIPSRSIVGEKINKEKSICRKAQIVESHTSQESFHSYILSHSNEFEEKINSILSWEELHQAFAQKGVEYCLRGNGAIIKDLYGKHAIKASDFHREFSKSQLEKRFGKFEACVLSQVEIQKQERSKYKARPLQKGLFPNKQEERLSIEHQEKEAFYLEFQGGMDKRRASSTAIGEKYTALEKYFTQQKANLQKMNVSVKERNKLNGVLIKTKKQEYVKLQKEKGNIQKEMLGKVPYRNWNEFLQVKVQEGNELALAVLRSKKEVVPQEKPVQAQSIWEKLNNDVQKNKSIRWQEKKSIASIARMQQVLHEENIVGATWKVDNKGNVLFTLPTGGLIKDSGKDVSYSKFDKNAELVAEKVKNLKQKKSKKQEQGIGM